MKRRNKDDLLSQSLVKAVKLGSILADVMLGKIYFSHTDTTKRVRKSKVYQTSADRLVKICSVCNMTWERLKISTKKRKVYQTLYYKNVPKYGKEIEICNKCSEEEE